MKKTFLFFIFFFVLGFNASIIQAVNSEPILIDQSSKELPPDYDLIVLQGNLLLGVGPNAIVAGYNENSVYLQFNQNFGYVDVTFYNPNGLIVYSNVVNTAVQQLVVIPITGFIDGIYTIVLENAYGYAEGDFEQNND